MTSTAKFTNFRKADFTIDDSSIFSGYTADQTWNGWACPYFDLETTHKILDWLTQPSEYDNRVMWSYRWDNDTLILSDLENPDDIQDEIITPVIVNYNGESIVTYTIGAYSWVWYELDNDNGVAMLTQSSAVKPLNPAANVYIVDEGGNGGYLSSNTSYFATKSAAKEYMLERKHSALDDGYKVIGSLKDEQYTLYPDDCTDHHLGEHITLNCVTVNYVLPFLPANYTAATMEDLIEKLNSAE